jgi:hypothetical protein
VVGLTATLLNWNNNLIHQVASCFPDLDQSQRVATTTQENASLPSTIGLLSRLFKIAKIAKRGFVLADQIEFIEADFGGETLVDVLTGRWDLYNDSARDQLKELAIKATRLLSASKSDRAFVLRYALFLPSLLRRKNFYESYIHFLSCYSVKVLQVSEDWNMFNTEIGDFSKLSDFDREFTDSSVSDDEFFSKIDHKCESMPREVVNWGPSVGREIW